MTQTGMKAGPSIKLDWDAAHREAFTLKLHRLGWQYGERYYSGEGYQKGNYRIEVDAGGLWLWTLAEIDYLTMWRRTHGLSSDDLDQIKDAILPFVVDREVKKFSLGLGEWL